MNHVKTAASFTQQTLIIAFIVLLACIALFSLDKDTHNFSDLLKTNNLFALVLYFTPTFIVSLLFFKLFSNKYGKHKSIVLSLVTGIPLSFALVICIFLLSMH